MGSSSRRSSAGTPPAGARCGGRARAGWRPSAAGSGPGPVSLGPAGADRAGRRARCRTRRESGVVPGLSGRLGHGDRDPRPGSDIRPSSGPERTQVRAHQVRQTLVLRRVGRSDPVLGQPEPVRSTPLPRPGRRDAHEVDPQAECPHESGGEIAELLDGSRAVRQRRTDPVRGGDQVVLPCPGGARPRTAPLLTPCLANAQRVAPVLAPRHDVDRRPQERGLDHTPILERSGQIVAPEARHPGP
jgi:hypothetical protein